jgi:hypothetical protein
MRWRILAAIRIGRGTTPVPTHSFHSSGMSTALLSARAFTGTMTYSPLGCPDQGHFMPLSPGGFYGSFRSLVEHHRRIFVCSWITP